MHHAQRKLDTPADADRAPVDPETRSSVGATKNLRRRRIRVVPKLAALLGVAAFATMVVTPAPAEAMTVDSSWGAPGNTVVPRTFARNTTGGLRIGPEGQPTVNRAPGYHGAQQVWAFSTIQRLENGRWVNTTGLPGYQNVSAWLVNIPAGATSGTMTYQFEYPSGITWNVFHYPATLTRGYRYRVVWEFHWLVGANLVAYQQVVPSVADDGRCATRVSNLVVPCSVYTDGSVMV